MKQLFLVLFCLYMFREVELYTADVHLSSSPSSNKIILKSGAPTGSNTDVVMNQFTILSSIDQTNDLPITYRYQSIKDGSSLGQMVESTTSLCNPEPETDLDEAMAMLVAQIMDVDDQSCPIKSGVYTKPSNFEIDLSKIGTVLHELFLFPNDEYATVELDIGDGSMQGYIDVDQ
ncbi:uncharacterized protein [Chelonus insularis]|uniref:uncharacterized protein n=1 Tax=Chelonus insularis TaxID=460826 RepID=UPI00158CF798|nr:uncharacterized protein LOC118064336 [Chelonus insularis]